MSWKGHQGDEGLPGVGSDSKLCKFCHRHGGYRRTGHNCTTFDDESKEEVLIFFSDPVKCR